MILISLLIVLGVEYYFRWGSQLRDFRWFKALSKKIGEQLSAHDFFRGWGGVAIILLTPVLLLLIFTLLFDGLTYSLVLFCAHLLVLFMAIGPKPLMSSLDNYFNACEQQDPQTASEALQEEFSAEYFQQAQSPYRSASQIIFHQSQLRYFSPIFWFVILGPFGALFYRLAHEYLAYCHAQQDASEHQPKLQQLVYWLEWVPTRVTSVLFLLAGDFVQGFSAFKQYLLDFSTDNKTVIIDSGEKTLGLVEDAPADAEENQQVIALIKRTFIIYLVLVAILTPLLYFAKEATATQTEITGRYFRLDPATDVRDDREHISESVCHSARSRGIH